MPIGFNDYRPSAEPPRPIYYPVRSDGEDELLVCARCGAVVGDRITHDEHHRRADEGGSTSRVTQR